MAMGPPTWLPLGHTWQRVKVELVRCISEVLQAVQAGRKVGVQQPVEGRCSAQSRAAREQSKSME